MATPDASSRDAAERLFQISSSREARQKMDLLERRMTSASPVSGRKRSRVVDRVVESASPAVVGEMAERCAVEDSESDGGGSDESASEDDGTAYGVVRADRSSGKGGGREKRGRGGGARASDAENERPVSVGGLARSKRHPSSSGKRAAAAPVSHASLLERFENANSRGVSPAGALTERKAGEEREAEHARRVKELEEKLAATERDRATFERACDEMRASNNDLKANYERVNEVRTKGVHQLAVKLAAFERKQMRMQIAEEGLRLGTIGVQRVGSVLQEVWEDGRAFHELDERLERLAESKRLAEEKRKQVKKKLPPPGSAQMDTAAHAEYVLSEEVHKARMAIIRKEEESIKMEREALEREKAAHIRALKRVRDEDGSRFNKHPVLGDRYVLMNLLGRGGFSEVYKAFDCVEMREVACKLHQLNPQWSEERKRTYVRHAARECSIHKSLDHPHVVRLIDVFEVDSDSFCTVLELCTGDDLDARLKAQGCISEREARAILAQVFSGLAYMSTGQKRIIHYDLKPGNILFDDAGRVKITDFGLSKIMEERHVGFGADSGMELTSQGAGTYWYLPPECFETGPAPPKISSKVDTWSCGVILFQMIYGRRPFGHDMSQEQILHAGTIRNAKEVDFPSKPAISPEGKAFITRCLAYKQSDRPDVLEASQDPYMTFLSK